jgi:hypothetical protein
MAFLHKLLNMWGSVKALGCCREKDRLAAR